ncbi:MAG: hypothetical protein ACREM1_11200 [Longimicrobiales bacterium]
MNEAEVLVKGPLWTNNSVCVVFDGEKASQITPHGRTVRSDLA